MPDLIIVDVPTCATNSHWRTEVQGQTGKYLVTFGHVEMGPVANDYTCSCPHFQYRLFGTGEYCKHIKRVIEQKLRCAWNAELEPVHAPIGGNFCPKCTGPLTFERVAV